MLGNAQNIEVTIDKTFFGVMSESKIVESIDMNYEDALKKCEYYNLTNYKDQKYSVVQLGFDGKVILNRDNQKHLDKNEQRLL